MPHIVASDLGPHCLSMSHKKGARLIWAITFLHSIQIRLGILCESSASRQFSCNIKSIFSLTTIVGILIFMTMINTTSKHLKIRKVYF